MTFHGQLSYVGIPTYLIVHNCNTHREALTDVGRTLLSTVEASQNCARILGNPFLTSRLVTPLLSLDHYVYPTITQANSSETAGTLIMAGLEKRKRDEATQYEKEQHRQALEATIVIPLPEDTDTAARMNALDLHVMAYVRLNNLPAARRDAVLMLRTNRKDGRGYVRCGQIERLAGDISAASQWYEHGLDRKSVV